VPHRGALTGDGNVRLLSYDELRPQKGIPYSKVHLWRLEREGKFPKRVPLSESRHGWAESEIDDWIAERMASRRVEAA
jgi:prophage regulatory protein